MRGEGVPIATVVPGSIASELGVEPGDRLIAVNGQVVRDIIEYRYYTADDFVVLDIQRSEGEQWRLEIEKDYDEDLGLGFDQVVFDGLRVCRNKCLFCFMDQLPPGMRKTLRVKDDDYRLSFLYGNFITLTNLDYRDWERILTLRLSPLYVSVHATDPGVRERLLGNEEARNIIADLERLKQHGLQAHTQIVLCPGINDKQVLANTVQTLAGFWPTVLSIGIVPVGLTNYREGLAPLQPVTRQEARELIEVVQAWQSYYRPRTGIGLVYLADEFFIRAHHEFPTGEYYDDYPQLENGIGLARQFLDRLDELEKELPASVRQPRALTVICGESAREVLELAAHRFNLIKGVSIEVLAVKNRFFGEQVTVTGLLTGRDIEQALGKEYRGRTVLIPSVVLREADDRFLDDMTVGELRRTTEADVVVVEPTVDGLFDFIVNIPGLAR